MLLRGKGWGGVGGMFPGRQDGSCVQGILYQKQMYQKQKHDKVPTLMLHLCRVCSRDAKAEASPERFCCLGC